MDFYIFAVTLSPVKQILEEFKSDYLRSKIMRKLKLL